MSPWLLGLVSLAYLYTGIEQGYKLDWNWLGFWSGYAMSNLYLIRMMLNALH
jgi:hypothetical protein